MSTLEHSAELRTAPGTVQLAPSQPESLRPLLDHMVSNINMKASTLEATGQEFGVLGPDWCRAYPDVAGQLHADVILQAYGNTYALPNKDPAANEIAIKSGNLDVYLLHIDRKVVATSCLIDTLDGRAELGRAASLGNVGGGIILDLRILDWLTNPETANKFHTLFTTLRTAPDRILEDGAIMRGGQAITAHWRKFPNLRVNGVAPLYFKHGALEQFTCASLSRNELRSNWPLSIGHPDDIGFVRDWHENYGLPLPPIAAPEQAEAAEPVFFEAHYPPAESELTKLVHADVVVSQAPTAKSLSACVAEASAAGSPFTQVVVPIDRNTTALQAELRRDGFQMFGYVPADERTSPALLFGKIAPDRMVVPTAWNHENMPHPFWQHPGLQARAETIAKQWQ